MSTTPPPAAVTFPPHRIKKRIYIPLILLLLFLGGALVLYVRGTWADAEEKNPATPADGALVQLLQQPHGDVVVRGAILVDASPAEVWSVVTDYDAHSQFLPYVSASKGTRQPDGRLLIQGVAHSRLWGDWPFVSTVTHHEAPGEATYSATWDEEDQDRFRLNRGGWKLQPADRDGKQTLLEFSIQVELKDSPNFLVRNIILDRLPSIVDAMRNEVLSRKAGRRA